MTQDDLLTLKIDCSFSFVIFIIFVELERKNRFIADHASCLSKRDVKIILQGHHKLYFWLLHLSGMDRTDF